MIITSSDFMEKNTKKDLKELALKLRELSRVDRLPHNVEDNAILDLIDIINLTVSIQMFASYFVQLNTHKF